MPGWSCSLDAFAHPHTHPVAHPSGSPYTASQPSPRSPTSGAYLSQKSKHNHGEASRIPTLDIDRLWLCSLLLLLLLKGLHLMWTHMMWCGVDLCQRHVPLAPVISLLMLCLQAPAAGAVTSQSVPSPVPAPAAQPPAQPPSPVRHSPLDATASIHAFHQPNALYDWSHLVGL